MADEAYNPSSIEKKWRKYWEDTKAHNVDIEKERPKYYCLDMFPYPSGEGLHVGHWRGYVLSDVWSRYKKLQGYNVLHPMGYDAFGLPAENDAIKKGIHPEISTKKNISNFKRQLYEIGAMYDWNREINTSDEEYYKWTQWIFIKMYERGLVYRKNMPINWCPSCKTGLANEEVIDGKCERCKSEITKKPMEQWMIRITSYADRLLYGLENLEWPEKVKKMQRNWIGKSKGAKIKFKIWKSSESIEVFTTRPYTLFGATYLVLAPEHRLVIKITSEKQRDEINNYINQSMKKSNVERMVQEREKTGAFTGAYAINPINNEKIPVWISDYVLADYAEGAIMAVPAHDERDFEFARTFDLPIRTVILKEEGNGESERVYSGKGVLVNSDEFTGFDTERAGRKIIEELKSINDGEEATSYKLRDWVFSRQRYWGEPIPIIHCERCGEVAVPEKNLPVRLPKVDKYQPTGTGESPLAAIDEWVNTTCPKCGGPARRETNTMPQWAGSSWYFLRYADPFNKEQLGDKARLSYWLPVDFYIGGVEHAILHLLYARFYTMFLYDIGVVDFEEPFKRLFNQGMICKNGEKMSKSVGNIVSPDGLVERYGTDSLRLYEMFAGPPELDSDWNNSGFEGVYRFLAKMWEISLNSIMRNPCENERIACETHKLVKTVKERMENFKMNTVISAFMSYCNFIVKENKEVIDRDNLSVFIRLIAPFAPHFAEEIWERLGNKKSIFEGGRWPEYDEKLIWETKIEIPVQINGKHRATIEIEKDTEDSEVIEKAKEAVKIYFGNKKPVKEIYVSGKIVNFVTR